MTVAKEDVVSFIDNMTVLEMSQFVKELEEKYGVTAAVLPLLLLLRREQVLLSLKKKQSLMLFLQQQEIRRFR